MAFEKTKTTLGLLVIVLLTGCASTSVKTCGIDKDCLKTAFKNCEQARGSWPANNEYLQIEILGSTQDKCGVFVAVTSGGTSLYGLNMTCALPKHGTSGSFDIKTDCQGELAKYFREEDLSNIVK